MLSFASREGAQAEPAQGKNSSELKAFRVNAFHKTADPATDSWGLELDDRGRAVVSLAGAKHNLVITSAARRELLRTVEREKFFELKGELGSGFIGGPFRVIDITLGSTRNKVVLLSVLGSEEDREGVIRALRVWAAIRCLFDISGAAASPEEDKEILGISRTSDHSP